jgi:hypothetical protein
MRKVLPIIILFVLSGIIYASLSFQFFTAKSTGDAILIEWKTLDEGGTQHFELERSANTPDNFVNIKSVNATGNNSYYSVIDNGINVKNNSSSSIYYYRLKCVLSGGSYSYTNIISVTHSVSGIKSTWGSIKAIFR